MKINWTLISFSIALLLCFNSHGNGLTLKQRLATVMTNNSISELTDMANDCETFWPSNATLYFQYESAIGGTLLRLATNNPIALKPLENQTERIMDKDGSVDTDLGNVAFRVKDAVVGRFLSVSNSTPDLQGAQMLAKFLGEVRTAMITNYQLKPTPNLKPPVIMVRPGFYKIDTNASPAYIKAWHAMLRTDDENTLQLHLLPKYNKAITSDFFNYSKVLFAQNPQLKSQANSLAALAHLTSSEQIQLDSL